MYDEAGPALMFDIWAIVKYCIIHVTDQFVENNKNNGENIKICWKIPKLACYLFDILLQWSSLGYYLFDTFVFKLESQFNFTTHTCSFGTKTYKLQLLCLVRQILCWDWGWDHQYCVREISLQMLGCTWANVRLYMS